MRRLFMLSLCCALGAISGCSKEMPERRADFDAPSPGNSYALDPAELRTAISKAEAGDVDAMKTLVDYYWVYRDDGEEEGLKWLKRAADAGDAEAKKALLGYCQQHRSESARVTKLCGVQ